MPIDSRLVPHIAIKVHGKMVVGIDPVTGDKRYLVYQKTRSGRGNIRMGAVDDYQCRRYVVPRDKRTIVQLQMRQRLLAANVAWKHLSASEKFNYVFRARYKPLTGRNLFIKEFCQLHPAEEFLPHTAYLTQSGEPVLTKNHEYLILRV
jgi:hypothetical protein